MGFVVCTRAEGMFTQDWVHWYVCWQSWKRQLALTIFSEPCVRKYNVWHHVQDLNVLRLRLQTRSSSPTILENH